MRLCKPQNIAAFVNSRYAVRFNTMPWESPLPGMRSKVFREQTKQLRLVEFSKGFVEPGWCEKGHLGFVISGELEIDFSGKVEHFPEGSALVIPAGKSHAHKARALTPFVRLFLVEEC